MLTETQLNKIMGRVLEPDWVNYINEAFVLGEINTPKKQAHFLAQIGHESAGLYYLEEIASGAAYNFRADLGNVNPGDGERFKGRGIIQLTGRNNYSRFSQWCFKKGLVDSPDYFVKNPKEVATKRWGTLSAVYYWTVARDLNTIAEYGTIEDVTRAVNGGLNGLEDRKRRYFLARETLGERGVMERVLDYPRAGVAQETFYNCGPATTQNILAGRGIHYSETALAKRLGTTTNGTDYIGQLATVLGGILGVPWEVVNLPSEPVSLAQKEKLWIDIKTSIDFGFGVAINIVAPPSNYPRGANGSSSPQYGGGTVYHYFAAMGYKEEDFGRFVWIADSGFKPFGYWITLDQLATLIPPKGYTHINFEKLKEKIGEEDMPAFDKIEERYNSLVKDADPNIKLTPLDFLRNADAHSFEANAKIDVLIQKLDYLTAEMEKLKK